MTNKANIKTASTADHEAIYQAAVSLMERDAMVLANAGCGKTHLLVEHYFHLLSQGLEPKNLVAFTFTEKAALELRDRILRRLPTHPAFKGLSAALLQDWQRQLESAFIGTIHQFCFQLLQAAQVMGGRVLNILEESTEFHWQERLLDEFLKERFLSDTKDPLKASLERLLKHFGMKNLLKLLREYWHKSRNYPVLTSLELPEATAEEATLLKDLKEIAHHLEQQLNAQKIKHQAFSFNDLEAKALQALKAPTKALTNFLKPFRYYLVDEFQDTAPIQIELLTRLQNAHPKTYLFCVGDPKQSIYGFRQVDQTVLQQSLDKILAQGGAKFDFTRNYRSVPGLLEFTNQYSTQAFEKALPSEAFRPEESPPAVSLIPMNNEDEKLSAEAYRECEAQWMADKILGLQAAGHPLGEIAVLFRAAASALPLIDALETRRLPFNVRGGRHLHEIQAVRDCRNMLSWLSYPSDDVALLGVLRSPWFLISDTSLYFLNRDRKKEHSLWQQLHLFFGEEALLKLPPAIETDEAKKLRWTYAQLKQMLGQTKLLSPAAFFRHWQAKLSLNALYAQTDQDLEAPLALEQFFSWLENTEGKIAGDPWQQTEQLVQEIKAHGLTQTPLKDKLSAKDSVQILTIHAAKGLEFETVFLGELNRGRQASQDILQQVGPNFGLKLSAGMGKWQATKRFETIKEHHRTEETLENKRLLYVALTRARTHMLIPLNSKSTSGSLQSLLLEELQTKAEPYYQAKELPQTSNTQQIATSPLKAGTMIQEEDLPQAFRQNFAEKTRTVSELETFVSCPLKHHYAYGLKISDKIYPPQAHTQDATEMGTLIHEALELMHRSPQKSRGEILRHLLLSKQLWFEEETLAQLDEALAAYQNSALFEQLLQAKEDYSELRFLIEVPAGKIRGQMDRLIKQKEGWTLIDFKYTQKNKNAAALLEQYGFQLKTYALAARQFLQQTLPKVEVHLLAQLTPQHFYFSDEELDAHQKHLNELLIAIQKADLTQVSKRPACHSCDFHRAISLCTVPQT